MQKIFEQLKDAMISKGITPPKAIIPSERIERFPTNGKANDMAGWYILYNGPIPAGAFGDWRTGCVYTWCSRTRNQMSSNEWIEHQRRLKNARCQFELMRALIRERSAERALKIWNEAKGASHNHPYLIKKRILPFNARQVGSSLILPIIDFAGKIWSLQFIKPDGSKRLLFGGAKKGHFIHVHGKLPKSKHLICEGFATGATLAQGYPDTCVIAAIDAGNLKSVAIGARSKLPDADILVCADDDRLTPNNPGITKGRIAALSARASFTAPTWPKDAPETLSDFNDLACWIADFSKGAI